MGDSTEDQVDKSFDSHMSAFPKIKASMRFGLASDEKQ